MITPYDWQEGIGHRASYVESRLASGTPVLALSLPEGILALTVRRQAHKLYEVYDRMMMTAIGQQSDVEALRVAAIDFAHQEGYQRSEHDVTIQRVISTLSQPLKRAFGDFNSSPFVVRSLFLEVANEPVADGFYVLDYDGDFSILKLSAYLAGNEDQASVIREGLNALEGQALELPDAVAALKPIWAKAMDPEGGKTFDQLTEHLDVEIAILERQPTRDRRFRRIPL